MAETTIETPDTDIPDDEVVPDSFTSESSSETFSPATAREVVVGPSAATGRRKQAIARVRLVPGTGNWTVNGRALDKYFPNKVHQQLVNDPFVTLEYVDRFDIIARIHGGGISGQAGAVRHGIARALTEIDAELRGDLKRRGFLTRDARVKERRKAGFKKARKKPQFSKR